MLKVLKSMLLLALIAFLPSFAAASPASSGVPVEAIQKATAKIMGNVFAAQTQNGQQQITAIWTSGWQGPFNVYLIDLTAGTGIGPIVTNLTTWTSAPGLIVGHTYVVSVHDDQTVAGSNEVRVKP